MADSISFKSLIIETADDLGCYQRGVASAASSQTTEADDTLTVAGLKDFAPDDHRFRNWFIAKDSALSTFRMVKSTTLTTDSKLLLTRGGFTASTNDVVHLFMVLPPDTHGWGLAINNALRNKYLEARFAVALVEGKTEYDLTAIAPWFKSWAQMLRVRERDENSGFQRPVENELSVFHMYDDYGKAMLQLPQSYAAARTGRSLIIQARRYYDPLSADSDVIYMQQDRLIRAEAKCEALYLIFNALGPGARAHFGQMMVICERERDEQRARHQQNVVKRDWSTEEERMTGDPVMATDWGW